MLIQQYWKSLIAISLTLIAGVASLAEATQDWQIWTAESARRQAVLNSPQPLSDAVLIDSREKLIKLLPPQVEQNPPLVLLEFIYTRCPTVCTAMGAEFYNLQKELVSKGLSDQVQLLSISFDPEDNAVDLNLYLQRFAANPQIWQAAKFANPEQLFSTMESLGVIVIPDPTIGYVHNAAVYMISQQKVTAILEHDDRLAITNYITKVTGKSVSLGSDSATFPKGPK